MLQLSLSRSRIGNFEAGKSEDYSFNVGNPDTVLMREDELMKKAYTEFISYPLSVRDEAVKMLAWRLI